MRGNDERMFSLEKLGSQLISDFICFFGLHFSGFEGLAQLVSDHFVVNLSAGDGHILAARKQKLLICGFRGAGICRDQRAAFCLIRVLHVIHPRFQALCNGLALVNVHRNDASRCHEHLRIKRKAAIRDSHKPPHANEVQ